MKKKSGQRENEAWEAILFEGTRLLLILGGMLALVTGSLYLLSDAPRETLNLFFFGNFQSRYLFGNLLNRAVPILLTSLGASIAFHSDNFNLGGEGQVYAGGVAATMAALVFPLGGGVLAPLWPLGVGACMGGGLAALSGWLKAKWSANELLTSILISHAIIILMNYLVTGPLRDPRSDLASTQAVGEGYILPAILTPSLLNLSLPMGLVIVLLVHLGLYHTKWGFETRLVGKHPAFARYAGISIGSYSILSFWICGFLHGVAGAAMILGTYHRAIEGFSRGIGWTGITVALIAKRSPLTVVPVAFFLAYLDSGARVAILNTRTSIEIVEVVRAIALLAITAEFLVKRRAKKRE